MDNYPYTFISPIATTTLTTTTTTLQIDSNQSSIYKTKLVLKVFNDKDLRDLIFKNVRENIRRYILSQRLPYTYYRRSLIKKFDDPTLWALDASSTNVLKDSIKRGVIPSLNYDTVELLCASSLSNNYELFKKVYDSQPNIFSTCNILDAVATKGCVQVFQLLEKQTHPVQLMATTNALTAAIANANWSMVDYLVDNRTEGCSFSVLLNVFENTKTNPSDKCKAVQFVLDHLPENSRSNLILPKNIWLYTDNLNLARSIARTCTSTPFLAYINDLVSLKLDLFTKFQNKSHHFIDVQLDIVYYLVVEASHYSALPYQELENIRLKYKDVQFVDTNTLSYSKHRINDSYLDNNRDVENHTFKYRSKPKRLENYNIFIRFIVMLLELLGAFKLSTNLDNTTFVEIISTLIKTGSTLVIPILFKLHYKSTLALKNPRSSSLFDQVCLYGSLEQVVIAYEQVKELQNDKVFMWIYKKTIKTPNLISAKAATWAAQVGNLEVLKYLDSIAPENKALIAHSSIVNNSHSRVLRYILETRTSALLPHYSYQSSIETLDLEFIQWVESFFKENQSIIDEFKNSKDSRNIRNDYPIMISRYIVSAIFKLSNQRIKDLLLYLVKKYKNDKEDTLEQKEMFYYLVAECCEHGNLEIFKWLEDTFNLRDMVIEHPSRMKTTIFDDAYLSGLNDELVEYLIVNRKEGFGKESWIQVGLQGSVKQLKLLVHGTDPNLYLEYFDLLIAHSIRRGNFKILNYLKVIALSDTMVDDAHAAAPGLPPPLTIKEMINKNLNHINVRYAIVQGNTKIIQLFLSTQPDIQDVLFLFQQSLRLYQPHCAIMLYEALIKIQTEQNIPTYILGHRDQHHLVWAEDITLLDFFIQKGCLDPKIIDRKEFNHMHFQVEMSDLINQFIIDKGFNTKSVPSSKTQLQTTSIRLTRRKKEPIKESVFRLVLRNHYLFHRILRETRITSSGMYKVPRPMDLCLDLNDLLEKKAYNWIKYLIRVKKEPLHFTPSAFDNILAINDVELFQLIYDNYRDHILKTKPVSDFSHVSYYALEQLSKEMDSSPFIMMGIRRAYEFKLQLIRGYQYPLIVFAKTAEEIKKKQEEKEAKEQEEKDKEDVDYKMKNSSGYPGALSYHQKDRVFIESIGDDDLSTCDIDGNQYWHHHMNLGDLEAKSNHLDNQLQQILINGDTEVAHFLHRNRTETYSAQDLSAIDFLGMLRFIQHSRHEKVGSDLFDQSIINQHTSIRNNLYNRHDVKCTAAAYNASDIIQLQFLHFDMQIPFDPSLYNPKFSPPIANIKFLIHLGLEIETAIKFAKGREKIINFILKYYKKQHQKNNNNNNNKNNSSHFQYSENMLKRLLPSTSFSKEINIQIIETRLNRNCEKFIRELQNAPSLDKDIISYLFYSGVPLKGTLIDSLLSFGDEELLQIVDPSTFSTPQIQRYLAYEKTQHVIARFANEISQSYSIGAIGVATMDVFKEFDLPLLNSVQIWKHGRRDCFKLMLDRFKHNQQKQMDTSNDGGLDPPKPPVSIDSLMVVVASQFYHFMRCSGLMFDYILGMITKEFPGSLSQKSMEHIFYRSLNNYRYDLCQVIKKYFNIRVEIILKEHGQYNFKHFVLLNDLLHPTEEELPFEMYSHLDEEETPKITNLIKKNSEMFNNANVEYDVDGGVQMAVVEK